MAVLVNSTPLLARPSPDKGKVVCGFSAIVTKIHAFDVRTRNARVLASTDNAISPKRNWFGDMDAKLKNDFFKFQRSVKVMRKPPSQHVARQLIERLCGITKTRKAIEVVEIMMGAGVLPDKDSYTVLVDHFCDRGNVWYAMQFIKTMEEKGHKVNPAAYHSVLRGLCRKRRLWDKILGWLDRYVEKGLYLNERICSYLLGIIYEVRGVDETMMFLDEMIAAKGWVPDIRIYNVILLGLCCADRSYEAIHLLDDLPSKGLSPNAYSYRILLLNLCSKGEWLEVKKLLAKMDARGVIRSHFTYNILISRLAHHGKIEEALQYLDEMLRERMKLTTATYNPIIQQLCKEGKVTHAVSFIKKMISNSCYPDDTTYEAIAKLCKRGMVKEAFSVIQFLEGYQDSIFHYFYKGVISALCRRGETVSAFELLYEMVCNGYVPASYTYAALIRGLCIEGKLDEAVQISRLLEEFHWSLDIEIFNALVEGFSKAGRMLHSLEFFRLMIEKGCEPNEMTYTFIVEGMLKAGEEELASDLLREFQQRNVFSDRTVERLEYQLE